MHRLQTFYVVHMLKVKSEPQFKYKLMFGNHSSTAFNYICF